MVKHDIPQWDLKSNEWGTDILRWILRFRAGKWWEFLLAYQAAIPVHKGINKERGGQRPPPLVEAVEGRLPYGWVMRLGRQ